MDAQKYVEHLRKNGGIIRLAHFDENGWCNGRGQAIVIDRKESIAMMLETCGRASITNITTGSIVKFQPQDNGEPKIIGEPASLT
ncbi:MAG: hypothetical protein KDA86_01265 [Planctomycetaceae bacterium]|nr:hypothetical protein [Planctomycetaceae bacterium]MCA9108934.1 hypothetical protein [Planctomycetaceae bacterium]